MTEEPKKRQPAKKPTARKTVEKPKIVISLDDVGSSEVDAIVSQLEEAKKVPLVRNIGEPEKTGSGPRAIGWMALAGVVGGIATWLAWGLTQSLFANDDDATRSNVVATVIVAALIAMALVFGDTLRASAYSKLGKRTGIGLAAAIGLGLIFGFIASSLYVAGTERIIEDLLASGLDFSDDQLYEQFSSRNQLNRGIAWMFVGLAAGLTVSIASLEWKRMLITGGGGLVGGFLGGYLFAFVETMMSGYVSFIDSQVTLVWALAVLIVVLSIRPSGLLPVTTSTGERR